MEASSSSDAFSKSCHVCIFRSTSTLFDLIDGMFGSGARSSSGDPNEEQDIGNETWDASYQILCEAYSTTVLVVNWWGDIALWVTHQETILRTWASWTGRLLLPRSHTFPAGHWHRRAWKALGTDKGKIAILQAEFRVRLRYLVPDVSLVLAKTRKSQTLIIWRQCLRPQIQGHHQVCSVCPLFSVPVQIKIKLNLSL
jgi:hypothetical protein